ncbi:hypothetical protein SC171_21290 [Pantoea cypripedii]|uniref:hypothetical protein n=1 Tax=Pantoea cypripedii TaxID=55209 RepID=UPI002FC6ED99
MIISNISAAASLQQTLAIQNIPDQASGTASSSSLPDAGDMGMVMITIPETLDELYKALEEIKGKIKEVNVKLAANSLIESLSRAGFSGIDAAVSTFSATGTGNGSTSAIAKIVMTVKDIVKIALDGINLLRAKDGEKALPSTTDGLTYAINSICTSTGCSAETTEKASNYGGYILNTLIDLAGTFSGFDPATISSDEKRTFQFVTIGTAGAKAMTGISKPLNEGLKAQKSALEKIQGGIEELIRQKEKEIQNTAKVSKEKQKTIETKKPDANTRPKIKVSDQGTQHTIETREQSADTQSLIKVADQGTQNTVKTREQSADTQSLIKVADQGTQNTIKTHEQSADTQSLIEVADAATNTEIRKRFGVKRPDVVNPPKSNSNTSEG